MNETPKVTKIGATFSMSCAVDVHIRAEAAAIWALLTNADDFTRWNSTVSSIEGTIRAGERIQLRVPNVDRTFKLKISDVVENVGMTWSDGFAPMFRGVRTFALHPRDDGSTDFSMEERFSGIMLPLIKGSLPDFGPVFERYASDLKQAAEGGAK